MKILLLILLTLLSPIRAHEYEPGVTPLFFYGEMDKVREIINLSTSKDNLNLTLDQEDQGYIINTRRKIGINSDIGLELSADILNFSPMAVGVGVSPLIHTFASFTSKIKTKEEAEKKIQTLPFASNQINEMLIGDKVRFQLFGGVSFYGIVGTFGLNTKIKSISAGGFQCLIEKVSKKELYIELKKVKDKGVTLQAQVTIPNGELSKIKRQANGFSYMINFTTEKGMKAYKLILAGKLQELEDQFLIDDENVIKLNKFKSNQERIEKSYGFGVPLLSILRYTNTHQLQNGEDIVIDGEENEFKTRYALSLKRRDSRLLGSKKIIETAFLVSYEGEKEYQSKLNMQLFFQHFINKGSSDKLIEVKNNLMNLTGLKDFLEFNIPTAKNLKFSKVQFSLKFGEAISKAMVHNPSEVALYFISLKGIDSKTDKVIDKLISLIEKNDSSPKNLALIGQKVWESPKLFEHTLELVKTCGGELDYEVSGFRISRLIKKLQFNKTNECSKVLSTQE